MSRTADYEAKAEALLKPVAEKLNVWIYDVEYVKEGGEDILRVFIDKEGGVGINDCEAVSRALSALLDEDDFIADAYILEVSSPGLGRQLTKDRHLSKSIGAEVEIKTYKPVVKQSAADVKERPPERKAGALKPRRRPAGSGKEFSGKLKSFDSEKIIIEGAAGEMLFKRGDIAMIRLKFVP